MHTCPVRRTATTNCTGSGGPSVAGSGTRRDVLIAVLLGCLVCVVAYRAGLSVLPLIRTTHDVWFASDTPRVYKNMVARDSNHHRTQVHPLFSLVAYSCAYPLRKGLGLDPDTAVAAVVAGWSSAVVGLFFAFLRTAGCDRAAAAVFTVLLAISSTGMFWFPVPETYALGTMSLLAALIVAALGGRRRLGWAVYVAVSAATLSFTVTNWTAGMVVTLLRCSWRRAILVTASAFSVVTILWMVERAIFPTAAFFIDPGHERRHLYAPDSERLVQVARSFAFHSIILPEPAVLGVSRAGLPWLHTQPAGLATHGPAGRMAVAIWTVLLGLGLWTFVRSPVHAATRTALAVTAASQLALHLVYGDETFLYALHYAPLLIAMVALSSLTKLRRAVLALTVVLIPLAAVNNAQRFAESVGIVRNGSDAAAAAGNTMRHPSSHP